MLSCFKFDLFVSFLQSFIKMHLFIRLWNDYPSLMTSSRPLVAPPPPVSYSSSSSDPVTCRQINQGVFWVSYFIISGCRTKIVCQRYLSLSSSSFNICLCVSTTATVQKRLTLVVWMCVGFSVCRECGGPSLTSLHPVFTVSLSVGFNQTLCSNSRSLKPLSLRTEL